MKCKICDEEFVNQRGINAHIRFKHKEMSIKEYYEIFNPIYCEECGNLIPYNNGGHYLAKIFCSKKCLKQKFSKKIPTNKGERKYDEEQLLAILRLVHSKYKGYVTQKLIDKETEVNHQIYHKYFGSFKKACELAKVPSLNPRTNFKKLESEKNNILRIVIDTREKKPYNFKNKIFKKLYVGDYMSEDFFKGVVFERKSINDLKSTLSGGKNTRRFAREIERAREKKWYVLIIIDGTEKAFYSTKSRGRMTNKGIYHNIKLFESTYADVCQFVFTGSRINSMKIIEFMFNWTPEDLKGLNVEEMISEAKDGSMGNNRILENTNSTNNS